MAICANQQRMYMGTARQYMEQQQAYQQGAGRIDIRIGRFFIV